MRDEDAFSSLLADKATVVLDGGLATELEKQGHDLNHMLWSARLLMDNPAAICEAHLSYAGAGADILITTSYQASIEGLMDAGLSRAESAEAIRRSVELADVSDEVGRSVVVAASIGPYGAFLADGSEYSGEYGLSVDALKSWHRPRMEILDDTSADLLAMETIPSYVEAVALGELLGEFPNARAWMTFSCRDGKHLHDGTPVAKVVDELAGHPQLVGLGVNCIPVDLANDLVEVISAVSDKPVIVYANASERFDAGSRKWSEPISPERYAQRAIEWRQAGARVIGGCCGTDFKVYSGVSRRGLVEPFLPVRRLTARGSPFNVPPPVTVMSKTSTKWDVERAMQERVRTLHPMGGCDLDTLLAHFRLNDQFSRRSLKQRIVALLSVSLRHPFTVIEKLAWGEHVRRYQLPHDPVFIIGHWRSGTTHLHNLLSHDPRFSYLDFGQTAMPHNLLNKSNFIGRWFISRSLPKRRGYDNVELTLESPQEEEEMALGSLNPLGYYCVYYFPRDMKRHFERAVFFNGASEQEIAQFKRAYVTLAKKLSIANGERQLLFKNPPSTARITLLRDLFPRAKFIYIHRNPYEVFASSLNRYYRLMAAFAWQRFEEVDFEEMVFYKYQRLLRAYLEQREQIPADRLVETSYEAITENPTEEIGRLYDHLQLPEKGAALKAISPYAESKKDYKRNVHQLTQAQVDRMRTDWAFSFEEWPYEVPEGIEIVKG